MKATRRTPSPSNKTLIETITVSATATFARHRIGMSRQFPATLTIADANIQFKEWADDIFKAYPVAPESVSIRFKGETWNY